MGDFLGDIVVLHNRYAQGLSEETILHSLQTTAAKLITAEKTLRESLKAEKNLELQDLIGRAYGLLIHSCQLSTKEALEALSLLKLGFDLNWIEGINDHTLNSFLFHNGRAHIARLSKEKNLDLNEVPPPRRIFSQKPSGNSAEKF